MKSSTLSRRKFLGLSAAAASATAASRTLLLDPEPLWAAESISPSDHLRFGIIGVGMRSLPSTGLLRKKLFSAEITLVRTRGRVCRQQKQWSGPWKW